MTMAPKVLKTEAEYATALAHVESLMDSAPGSAEESELELWSVLVEKYEEEHFPIERPDPVSAIEFRMEQQGLTRNDLRRFITSKSKVSEVLARKRPLSLAMIRALHKGLNIPAEVLLQEQHTRRSRRASSETAAARTRQRKAGGVSATRLSKKAGV